MPKSEIQSKDIIHIYKLLFREMDMEHLTEKSVRTGDTMP